LNKQLLFLNHLEEKFSSLYKYAAEIPPIKPKNKGISFIKSCKNSASKNNHSSVLIKIEPCHEFIPTPIKISFDKYPINKPPILNKNKGKLITILLSCEFKIYFLGIKGSSINE
jgi:hypothetical protein